jgi:hypothetical protein
MSRARRYGLTVVLSALVQACSSPLESCAAPRRIVGVWQYSATEDAPASTSLSGTLLISRQTCRDFEGVLDIVEVRGGQTRRAAGPVTGALLDSVVARFDVSLGGVSRQHLARFGGDSVAGSWVEVGASSAAAGRFVARLQAPE